MGNTLTPSIDPLMQIGAEAITSLVDEGVEIEGIVRIKSDRAVLISGKVIGMIDSQGPVIINVNGSVHGSIRAKALQVLGGVHRVSTDDIVKIDGPLVLCKSSHMGCDAEAAGVQMAYGATIDGALRPNKLAAAEVEELVYTPQPVVGVEAVAVSNATVTAPAAEAPLADVPASQPLEAVAAESLTGEEGAADQSADFQDSVAGAASEIPVDRIVLLNDVRATAFPGDRAFSMEDHVSAPPAYLRQRS